MSNAFIYHALNIKGWDCISGPKILQGGGSCFAIAPQDRLVKCPVCGEKKEIISKGRAVRTLRAGSVCCHEQLYVEARIPIIYCKKCNTKRQIDISQLAKPLCSYTRQLAAAVTVFYNHASINSICELLDLSWNKVKAIIKEPNSNSKSRWHQLLAAILFNLE
jgi:transcription elongation factor Elf1